MKLTHTILALLAAVTLGHSALGDNGPTGNLGLAVTQDGHGGSHFLYYVNYQPDQAMNSTSVALSTSSGGVGTTISGRNGVQNDNGQTRFVIGTNGHGTASAAYIPVNSHFAPAGQ